MIDVFIDYHEAVVSFLVVMECNSGILGIVSSHVLAKLSGNLPVIDVDCYPGPAL